MRLGYSSTASRCGNAEMQPKIPTVVPLALDRTTVEYQSLYRTEHTTRTEGRDKYSNLSLLRNWLLGTAELDLLQFLVCF